MKSLKDSPNRRVWTGLSAMIVFDIVLILLTAYLVQAHYAHKNVVTLTKTTTIGGPAARRSSPITQSPTPQRQTPLPNAPTVLGSAIASASTPTKQPLNVGIFISNVPGEAGSLETLAAISNLGCTVAYNYSLLDGTHAAILEYLAYAKAHDIMIIVSLDNLYGSGDETVALQAVRDYASNPAVWGFGISDEKPEGIADIPQWMPVITDRYQKIKQLTAKPVMSIAVGWSSSDNGQRAKLLRSFAPASDVLAIDNYPIPYYPATGIDALMLDGPLNRERWFIAQAFSWAAYPETADGLGYQLNLARYPTTAEMVDMARQALRGGATTIMYYSYFDISSNAEQLSRLRSAISILRAH